MKNTYSELISRTPSVALYKRTDGPYEVFNRRYIEERTTSLGYFKGGEVYPSNEDFGVRAWTYYNEKAAINKYNELNNPFNDLKNIGKKSNIK